MRMYDIILKKRNKEELTREEIEFFVKGFNSGDIKDYQASALLMAIFLNKMSKKETADLTMAIVNSGEVLNLDNIDGVKVDKHSTGGVGDTTTLIVAPLVASLGVKVSKMSGRGLGHTGGTIDKLEALEGFSVELSKTQFIENINNIGIALVSQTGKLAPADKKIYALRDVTATVDSISLIASSIMSKKIASGADKIVLDVKVGDGAFMKNIEDARKLAKEMVSIGKMVDRETIAVISDMNQPLGYAIGNSLEVIEAIETLKGNGPKDLLKLSLTLASNMLMLAKVVDSIEEGEKKLLKNIQNGKALRKFKEFVKAQGGNIDFIDDTNLFKKSKYVLNLKSEKSGIISNINSEMLGIIAMDLGAGRETKESIINLNVGIVLSKKRGETIEEGDILAKVYSDDLQKGEEALKKLKDNIIISKEYIDNTHLIYEVIS